MNSRYIKLIIICLLTMILSPGEAMAQSVRKERIAITEGNKLFVERKFKESAEKYKEAIKINESSAVGHYNLGLAQIKQVSNPQDTTPKNKELLDNARKNLNAVAALGMHKPGLASKANYNLGNLAFNSKDFKNAVLFYKQALRINPNDESARKNLRIAQKNIQNQDQDKNQDKNKEQNKEDNKEQNQQDQNNNQNKDQNQDQNKQENKQQPEINQQAADQILQAVDNKENQTRARVQKASKGDKSVAGGSARRKW